MEYLLFRNWTNHQYQIHNGCGRHHWRIVQCDWCRISQWERRIFLVLYCRGWNIYCTLIQRPLHFGCDNRITKRWSHLLSDFLQVLIFLLAFLNYILFTFVKTYILFLNYRSVWHYPLRLENPLYIEVVFNQIAPGLCLKIVLFKFSCLFNFLVYIFLKNSKLFLQIT